MNEATSLDYLRRTAVAGVAAGLILAVAGCAGVVTQHQTHPARPAGPAHASRQVHAARQVKATRQVRPVRQRGAAAPGATTRIALTAHHGGTSTPAAHVAASGYHGPHFRTVRGAMTYLAAAYNRHDNAALHAVTTPNSFKELMSMRSGAIDLQLKSCRATGRGDYSCTFTHRYPHSPGHGSSDIIAAPALNPGWYMYQLLDCG